MDGGGGVPHDVTGRKLEDGSDQLGADLTPREGILETGSAVVDHDAVGPVGGSVPGSRDHQVDGKVDRNDVAHGIELQSQGP